jgi:hypothetical protein
MNKTTLTLLAAATALFALSSAHAQEAAPKLYGELGYTQLNIKESDPIGPIKFSPKALTGVFGYQFAPHMAVEGMLGINAGKGNVKFNGAATGVDGKLKTALGVFFRPSVSVSDSIDLFGRIGWVHGELELSAPGVSASERDDSLAYGVGANFNLSKTSYIQTNWMNYYKKDGVKIDGFTVAYGVRF